MNDATRSNLPNAQPTQSGTTTHEAEAARPSNPGGSTSAVPPPAPAADEDATLLVTTQAHVHCPLIAPSLRADCGFLPLPKVKITVTPSDGDVSTWLTGDDGTVRVPVSPGVVGLRGAPVSREVSRPPRPVLIEVVPNQIQAVVLIYEHNVMCQQRAEISPGHLTPRTYNADAGAIVSRGACP